MQVQNLQCPIYSINIKVCTKLGTCGNHFWLFYMYGLLNMTIEQAKVDIQTIISQTYVEIRTCMLSYENIREFTVAICLMYLLHI